MSNPVITFSDNIPLPTATDTVRKTFTMKIFDSIDFFIYPDGVSAGTYDPTAMGNEFYYWYMVKESLIGLPGPIPPDFIASGVWDGVQGSPSGFVTPNHSVMPKLFTPSTLMVDNGIEMPDHTQSSYWTTNYTTWHLLFNWILDTFNGNAIDMTSGDWYKRAQIGSHFGSQYVSAKAKDDASGTNTLVMHMISPTEPPTPTGDWDNSKLVVGGAFMLMLNILGTTPGQVGTQGLEDSRWSIVITFGDVTMTIADASTMTVEIAGNDQKTTVNLAEGMSKEGPPQQTHMADKPPLLIGVYPCWNGIMVVSGQQETPQVTNSAGTFCRKTSSASIQDPVYCTSWFDPHSPQNVEISVDSNVLVDFGDTMTVTAKNCRFEIAYLPRFFNKKMKLDGWMLLSSNTPDSTYSYNIYTIYTANGTSFQFVAPPTLVDSGYPGAIDNTEYWYVTWEFISDSSNPIYNRFAGEIFGYVLETIQSNTFSIKNGNGSFELTWTGGTPGDSVSTTWPDYIKNITVTIGIDGSSGNITVDKYGVAGQDAVANQSIGAVVLSAAGGADTVDGDIFYGLGMGVSNANTSGDSTWTIPLIGLEKKLDDIALINAPFMDGETLATAIDYLCRYAGISYNTAAANPSLFLSASEEINSARFDWKSGTSVKTALEEVMQDVNHWYCVRDGAIFFYQLDDYGLPVTPGPDRSVGYDSTTIVSTDQTPDFEDLRNYLVGVALRKVPEGTGTKIQQTPTFPEIQAQQTSTVPDVPWAKCLVRVYPGALDATTLSGLVDKMTKMSSRYQLSGRLSIPGNASIKPYDLWGEFIVYSVTHNVDLQAKTWTTDLEFARKAI